MKRICLCSSVVGAACLLAPQIAGADPFPGIVYVPSEAVDLTPSSLCPISQSGGDNSGLGCVAGLTDPLTREPFEGDVAALVGGLETALAPFDVMVTQTRPPAYVPYMMLMPSNAAADMSTSYTCVGAPINCASLKRNHIVFTNGTTMNCMDPDALHAVLYAFGRSSGLEGTDNPADPMGFPPDYMNPVTAYEDACAALVPQLNDMMMNLPLECTSADHENSCTGDDTQNSHEELLALYGARTDDTEAPVLSNVVPEDGTVFQVDEEILMDVDIADDDTVIAVRWTIQSDAIPEDPFIGGIITKCTNDSCNFSWDTPFFQPPDSDWAFPGIFAPGAGEYNITLEAMDMHGNAAETVMMTVTVEGGATDTTGPTTTSPTTTGADTTGTGDTGDSVGGDGGGDDSGCSCRTTPAPAGGAFALALLGLVWRRRR